MGSAPGEHARLEELILYVAAKMNRDRHAGIGRIKLAKLLWRIDFTAYWKLGRPITETMYWADELGPVPADELTATLDLQAKGRFEWERDWDRRQSPVVHDAPRIALFTPEELALIDDVVDRYRNTSGKQMVEDAHEFPGWVHAWSQGQRTPIPYESVFWDRRTELTDEEQRHAAGLAVEFGHLLRR